MNNKTLHALTHHIPCAPWWGLFPRGERTKLRDAELVFTYFRMVALEIPDPLVPLFDSRRDKFDASKLSGQLRRRIGQSRAVYLFSATAKGKTLMGGIYSGEIRSQDTDHDHLLSFVYAQNPKGWRAPKEINGELPDAMRGRTIIEIGGSSYSPEKLERRHRAWEQHHYLLY